VAQAVDITLTPELVLEASPMPQERKDQLRELLESSPELFTDRVNREAWQHLIRWYREKEEEVGEVEAFWDLVYRILDKPTLLDLECIHGYMVQRWGHASGLGSNKSTDYSSWWWGFWPE
jgi:hypothetical protein